MCTISDKEEIPLKREDAKEPGSLAFIMKKLFSKQLTVIGLFGVLLYLMVLV